MVCAASIVLLLLAVDCASAFAHPLCSSLPSPIDRWINRRHTFLLSDLTNEPMYLSEENAQIALECARKELTTLFGYSQENKAVGITGEVDFVEIDGVDIVVRLKGNFWHARDMVLARVANYVKKTIPEAEVRIEDPKQLSAGKDDAKSSSDFYRSGL